MPALITHYLHAMQVYKRLEDKNIDERAFCLGAQGPDFLYFHRALPVFQPGKTCRNIGTLLHQQKPDDLFSAFAQYILKNPQDKYAYSYALGFLCHYSLDRICHPYVYFQQDSIIESEKIKYNPGYVHSRIEHSLDVIMLREKTGKTANSFRADSCLTDDNAVIASAASICAYVINSISECKISEKQLVQAFKDTRFLQRMSYDPISLKRTGVRMLEKICFMPASLSTFIRPMMEDDRWDYSNYQKSEWKNPFDEDAQTVCTCFFDVFDAAVDDSEQLINRVKNQLENGQDNINTTGNYSFKTGLVMQ